MKRPGLGRFGRPAPHSSAGSVLPPADPAVLCRHCGRPAIEGEGARVCMICVFFYGSAAAAPAELSDMERRVLVEAHGDVVDLVMPSIEGRAYWRWRQA